MNIVYGHHSSFDPDLFQLVLGGGSWQQLVVGLAQSGLSGGQRRGKQRQRAHLQHGAKPSPCARKNTPWVSQVNTAALDVMFTPEQLTVPLHTRRTVEKQLVS